ncbi:MAG: glutamate synthase subunit beta [Deltaproteobacteria bacterium]|nr:glutamate synthase subunit beta [Deltaproteobacteria bacterium]
MGKITGFMEYDRETPQRRPVAERTCDWKELYAEFPEDKLKAQAARCMDCGVPFCHSGCPLGNLVPFWNDMIYKGRWKDALDLLLSTASFPEFTGRVCPALCEASCVLNIDNNPVSVRQIELEIVERGFKEGWIKPEPPLKRTGKKVAVVGSGPAGLAAAQLLNKAGHIVTLFEKSDRMGGILMYGIPDFKIEKHIVQRRVDLMAAEGVIMKPSVNVGVDYKASDLIKDFDAVCLTGGSMKPRDLPVPGRELKGIHFAMEYLVQQNKKNAGVKFSEEQDITAKGKKVVILGGGDTGADCVGTAVRQGATAIYQYELLLKPPEDREADNPWPQWPRILRTSSSHEEGGVRDYCIATKSFSGSGGKVTKLHAIRVEWAKDEKGNMQMKEIPGSEFEQEADLVLLAMGFLSPVHEGLLDDLGVKYDARGNVAVNADMQTSVNKLFSAGDMSRGQSLVVWAIRDGRAAAKGIDKYLMGETEIP